MIKLRYSRFGDLDKWFFQIKTNKWVISATSLFYPLPHFRCLVSLVVGNVGRKESPRVIEIDTPTFSSEITFVVYNKQNQAK